MAANTPESVAIVAMGDSHFAFTQHAVLSGGCRAIADEIWGINIIGAVVQCDRIFLMDDVDELIENPHNLFNVPGMLGMARDSKVPVYSSRADCRFPGVVEYPINEVLADLDAVYFRTTVDYAIAYAIHLGVKEILLYGCDFTYPDKGVAEEGKDASSFWLGVAHGRGIKIHLSNGCTLLDSHKEPQHRLYGYQWHPVELTQENGKHVVVRKPIAEEALAAE